MVDWCFKQVCDFEAQYVCLCLSSITKCCESHLQEHLKSPNIHILVPLLKEPSEETKDTFLEFLALEKLKKEKLKNAFLTSFNQNWNETKNSLEASLQRLDSDLKEISFLIYKISQVSEEEGQLLNQLMPYSAIDAERMEAMLQNDSKRYNRAKLFWSLSWLRKNSSKILSRANNDWETEQNYRKICTLYENHPYDASISQAYQECISAYHKITSTFHSHRTDKKIELCVFDTENEREEMKTLKIEKDIKSIDRVTQLPNGELFAIGNRNYSDNYSIAFIIDINYQARKLTDLNSIGPLTVVYFNRSIYCFGCLRDISEELYFSQRFDLDENRWIELAHIYEENDCFNYWDSIIFNGNILISKNTSCYLLLYLIDINSFSEIPYKFAKDKRKILINAEKRLYLIECGKGGYVYESEADNECAWNPIALSIIYDCPSRVYHSYNKGGIYISTSTSRAYYKFDLSKKSLIDVAVYNENWTLIRKDDNIEYKKDSGDYSGIQSEINKYFSLYFVDSNIWRIEELDKTIGKLDPNFLEEDHIADAFKNKGKIQCVLGWYIEAIQTYDEAIYKIPDEEYDFCLEKCSIFRKIGKNLEAIECYNEAIKMSPEDSYSYICKGDILYDLGRYLEAIDCFDEVIKLAAQKSDEYLIKGVRMMTRRRQKKAQEWFNKAIEVKTECWAEHFKKGKALLNLARNLEAIECFDEVIKLKPDYPDAYNSKGEALLKLGKNLEAIECFDEVIKLEPGYADAYNSKGEALRRLGRNIEATECCNEAAKLETDGDFNKGGALSDRNLQAIECYDEAIKRKPDDADFYNNKGCALFDLEKNIEAIECYNMAIKLNDNSIYFANRAKALSKLGKETEALQDSNKAEDLMKNMR